MQHVFLRVPTFEEMHYRYEWMMDPSTMSYNAGYDMTLSGYDYETGTITKTDAEIRKWYEAWIGKEPDRYFAYIYIDNNEEPIGEIYYYLRDGRHCVGIVIQNKYRGMGYSYPAICEIEKVAFEKNAVSELSDMVPLDRISAITAFRKAGFVHTDVIEKGLVFGKESIARELLITKDMYFARK